MKPGTFKVRRSPIHEVVTNYDEIRSFLTDNGYGHFFEDAPDHATAPAP